MNVPDIEKLIFFFYCIREIMLVASENHVLEVTCVFENCVL